MKKYEYSVSRTCERCGKVVVNHSNSSQLFAKMRHCAKVGLRKYCKSCSNAINMTGKKLPDEVKQKMRESHLGLKQSSDWVEKRIPKGKDHYMYGRSVPSETRRKIRLSILKRIETLKGKVVPRYNPEACRRIDEYGRQHGYTFQHAENGGEFSVPELGYWVDGYDRARNTVVEYYEKWHKRTQEHDKQRKQEIINQLGCNFIEIHE